MTEIISNISAVVGAVALLVFGGGGVVAWVKHRSDVRRGVHQERRSDSDSLNAQAQAVVEMQFMYLVQPLREELTRLSNDMEELREEVKTIRHLYKLALEYIKALLNWINRHPAGIDTEDRPPVPPALVEEL